MDGEVIHQFQAGAHWDWRVALDLFLGGAGVGALLFAVLLDERFKGKHHRICHTGAWLSPVLIAAGLALVMAKLGRPFHLFLAYTNFNPESPLWWGGIFQPLLVVAAIVYAIQWRNPQKDHPARKWMGRVVAPLAVIVGAYHGLLLGVLGARPLWTTGPTVVAAMLGFASTGIAVVMVVHLARVKLSGGTTAEQLAAFLTDMRVVRNSLVVILVLQLGTFFLWWLSLTMGSIQDQAALAAANEAYGGMFWWLGIGLGAVLPLILGGTVVFLGEETHRRLQVAMIGLTSLMILVGGFFFRLAVLYAGQIEPPATIAF